MPWPWAPVLGAIAKWGFSTAGKKAIKGWMRKAGASTFQTAAVLTTAQLMRRDYLGYRDTPKQFRDRLRYERFSNRRSRNRYYARYRRWY